MERCGNAIESRLRIVREETARRDGHVRWGSHWRLGCRPEDVEVGIVLAIWDAETGMIKAVLAPGKAVSVGSIVYYDYGDCLPRVAWRRRAGDPIVCELLLG